MSIGSTTAETGAARFSRHVALTLGAKLVIAGGSMLGGIIVARWLGAASVGTLASINVISLLAISFGGIGMSPASTFLIARDKKTMKRVMVNAISFAVIAGAILAFLIISIKSAVPQIFGDIPSQMLTIAAIAVPFQFLTIFCLSAFLGLGDIKRYNLLDVFSQGILFLNPLIVIAFLGMGLLALVLTNAVTSAILSLVWVFILFHSANSKENGFGFDWPLMTEMFRYGSKFYVATVSAVIILRADLLLVNYFRSASEAGVYAVALQVGTMLTLIPGVISTVLFPRVSETPETSAVMTCRVTRHAALIMLAVCLAVIPPAFLLPILYGQAFNDVPFLVLLLLPGVCLLGIETVQVQYFNSQGLPKAIPAFWVVTMLLFISLDIVFVPIFGAYAAAAVSSVAYSLMFVLVAVYFRMKTQISFSDAFLLSREEFRSLFKLTKRTSIDAELG